MDGKILKLLAGMELNIVKYDLKSVTILCILEFF